VFLHSDGSEFQSRIAHGTAGTDYPDCERREPQQRANQKRWQMRPNLRRPDRESLALMGHLNDTHNQLMCKHYFLIIPFHNCLLQISSADSYTPRDEKSGDIQSFFDFAERRWG
jgi:hypothetical protein